MLVSNLSIVLCVLDLVKLTHMSFTVKFVPSLAVIFSSVKYC